VGIQAIDHLYVEARSFDEARAFWEALGFTLVDQWGAGDHRAGRLEAGNTFVVLVQSETPVLTVHFRVDDVEAIAASIADDRCVKVALPPESTHWGTRWMRVEDGDGRVYALEQAG
jgi:catechol 2,3-dioxygenase-like lactoylglutathione lyase family enzyme